MNRKGVSPLIAVVLLIAFTIGIGMLLVGWLGSLSGEQMEKTSESADKEIRCSAIRLELTDVDFGNVTNVTLRYTHGTENIYNFSMTFIDNTKYAYTLLSHNVTPQYNDTAGQRFSPGMTGVWNIDTTSMIGTYLDALYVSALCMKDYPISTKCESGDECMK